MPKNPRTAQFLEPSTAVQQEERVGRARRPFAQCVFAAERGLQPADRRRGVAKCGLGACLPIRGNRHCPSGAREASQDGAVRRRDPPRQR
eukprot:8824247-Lingulodinium_polyedra.AAC.1